MKCSGVIIGGASRSGKSLLAGRLCRDLGITHVPVDALVDAFAATFPMTQISHTSEQYSEVSANLGPFLYKYLSCFSYHYKTFVADTVYVEPELLSRAPELELAEVLFLGYAECDPVEKLAVVRKYEREKDWTRNFSDKDLLIFIQRYIDRSKYLRDECERLAIRYVDTGSDMLKTLDVEYVRLRQRFVED